MSTDTRTPDEIERDIEHERAALTHTIDDLQDRFSFEGVVNQIGEQLRENGGDISRTVGRSVRENPMALALTGVGLAWLIFGKGSSAPAAPRANGRFEHDYDRQPGAHYDTDVTGSSYPARSVRSPAAHSDRFGSGFARTPAYTTTPSWARGNDDHHDSDHSDGRSLSDRASKAGASIGNGASAVGRSVSDGASRAGSAVSGAAHTAGSAAASTVRSAKDSAAAMGRSVRDGVSSAAGSAADSARAGRDSVAAGASALRQRLAEGTENLSEEARQRVIAARERAVAARQEAERAIRRSSARASQFYEDQPLVAGLLAMAAGAAVAGALPRTRYEDEHLGAYSDQLMEEAETVFREEVEKAKRVAQKTGDEVSKIARETKKDLDSGAPGDKSAAEAVADKVKQDGKRIADTARSEAEKEKLGKAKA